MFRVLFHNDIFRFPMFDDIFDDSHFLQEEGLCFEFGSCRSEIKQRVIFWSRIKQRNNAIPLDSFGLEKKNTALLFGNLASPFVRWLSATIGDTQNGLARFFHSRAEYSKEKSTYQTSY